MNERNVISKGNAVALFEMILKVTITNATSVLDWYTCEMKCGCHRLHKTQLIYGDELGEMIV